MLLQPTSKQVMNRSLYLKSQGNITNLHNATVLTGCIKMVN